MIGSVTVDCYSTFYNHLRRGRFHLQVKTRVPKSKFITAKIEEKKNYLFSSLWKDMHAFICAWFLYCRYVFTKVPLPPKTVLSRFNFSSYCPISFFLFLLCCVFGNGKLIDHGPIMVNLISEPFNVWIIIHLTISGAADEQDVAELPLVCLVL